MGLSWDDHRIFLAIARARTLSAAAKTLGVSQPTVSRRLAAMEARLRARLFTRTRTGYQLTEGGARLFETVVRVEEALAEADRTLQGEDQSIAGPLRFTSTEIFVNGYLGPVIWEFLGHNPGVEVSLICTQTTLNLGQAQADLAIRFTDNPPEGLVGRRLGVVGYGVYAAAGARDPGELSRARWIGMHSESFNRMLFGAFAPRVKPHHRVDNMAAMQAMVRTGLGVAILPCYTADRDRGLRRLTAAPLIDSKFSIWLLYHPDVRGVRRLRLFADFIAGRIKGDADLFEGRRPLSGAQNPMAPAPGLD